MTNIFDTHAHYSSRQFDADRDAVMRALGEGGVVGVLECATHSGDAAAVLELAHKYPFVHAALGIHPESLGEEDAATVATYHGDWRAELAAMRPLFDDPAVIAVGEIGLDHHWPLPAQEQYDLFEAQLQLAQELDLPVSVHDREAHAEMYELLRQYRPRGAFPEIDLFGFMSEENNHLLSSITVKQQNYIYSILQQLIQMQDENSPESAVTRKMLLATLLLQLKKMCENQHELGGDSGRVTNRIVSQIQGYIAEHYAEKLTLTSIANQFYISPYYLSRLFKKTINLSLIEYINGVRIKAAQNMIEKTNESISSVAEKTGFMTSAHFRRVFKEATGLSPQQYRQYFKRVNKPEK